MTSRLDPGAAKDQVRDSPPERGNDLALKISGLINDKIYSLSVLHCNSREKNVISGKWAVHELIISSGYFASEEGSDH